jgi:hypothetical protein
MIEPVAVAESILSTPAVVARAERYVLMFGQRHRSRRQRERHPPSSGNALTQRARQGGDDAQEHERSHGLHDRRDGW